jgi:hypothetical protein
VPIGKNVTSIGYGAFQGCTGLTSTMFSACISDIGNSAFERCTALRSVTLPNSINPNNPNNLTSIGYLAADAFYGDSVIINFKNPLENPLDFF